MSAFGDGAIFKSSKAVSDFLGMLIRIGIGAAIAYVLWQQGMQGGDLAVHKLFVSMLFWLLTIYLSILVSGVVLDRVSPTNFGKDYGSSTKIM